MKATATVNPLAGVVGVSHLFTDAGLGAAPFKIIAHDPPWSGWGGCNYCGTAIREKFYLESADGKRFRVGNECIRRAGGAGLFSIAQRMHREAQPNRGPCELVEKHVGAAIIRYEPHVVSRKFKARDKHGQVIEREITQTVSGESRCALGAQVVKL